ncbi:S24 family peptidase [Bosea sp. AS-1]|uniref:XRE family transcriptional regulator n=1 Tax=Bosea sp. AS-1 TaxID=2015316 RepID=UPI000B78E6E2|nr:S24 family peptidase [Bosea sp. AS-1]
MSIGASMPLYVHYARTHVKSNCTDDSVHSAQMSDERPEQAVRLQKAREARGFSSAREAALRLGFNYETYSQHERGLRGLSRAAADYAKAFKVSIGWLLNGEGAGPGEDSLIKISEPEPNAVIEDGPVYLPSAAGPRDIEELGAAMAGDGKDESAFEFNGQVVDLVKRPPGLLHRKDVFALRVSNVSMYPKYEDGERLYIEKRKPAIGEYVVVELHPKEEGRPGKAYIKKLLAANASKITVEQFNPHGVLNFSRDEVRQLLRVIPQNELLGF